MDTYKGTIIENSLADRSLLDNINILETKNSTDWILHDVLVNKIQIESFGRYMSTGPWYMHFWQEDGDNIIVVFKDKNFTIKQSDKGTWTDAIEYGIALGIPKEQLDFAII